MGSLGEAVDRKRDSFDELQMSYETVQPRLMATRTCPFADCDWSKEYDEDRYSSTVDADMASETHYEREHGGRVRVTVAIEHEQILGSRDPQDVADYYHEKYEGKHVDAVAWVRAEVIEEADDHSAIEHNEDDV